MGDKIYFEMPDWLKEYSCEKKPFGDDLEKMNYIIEASRQNIQHKTGGPFAAGIFETETGRLVSLGVNLVTTQKLSVLHAEIVAIMAAQQKLQTFDLGGSGAARHEIVVSTEPCAMCLGAIVWSGVVKLVTGARDEDAGEIGFDEGPKDALWQTEFRSRGIEVVTDVNRQKARKVLQLYRKTNGLIYNARSAYSSKNSSARSSDQ